MRRGGHGAAGVADYDLTALLERQLAQGLWDGGRVSVTFVFHGVKDQDARRGALPPWQAIQVAAVELRRD